MLNQLLPVETFAMLSLAGSLTLFYARKCACSASGTCASREFARKHNLVRTTAIGGECALRGLVGEREFAATEQVRGEHSILDMSLKPRCKLPHSFIAEEIKSSGCTGEGAQYLMMKDGASRCLRFAAETSEQLEQCTTDDKLRVLQSVLPLGVSVRDGALHITREIDASEEELDQACHLLVSAVNQLEAT